MFNWVDAAEAETRRKASAELALYVYTARDLQPVIRQRLCDRVASTIQHGSFAELVCRDKLNFPLYAPFALCAKAAGTLPQWLFEWLHTSNVHEMLGIDRVPYRILEIWHFLNVLGVSPNPVSFAQVVRLSCLHFPINPFRCGIETAYALTHNIFYLSDFGRNLSHTSLLQNVKRLRTTIHILILRFIAERNFDVVAELGMCALILGDCDKTVLSLAIRIISRQIVDDGTVEMDQQLAAKWIRTVPQSSLFWSQRYHTMLVSGLFLRQYRNRVPSESLLIFDTNELDNLLLALAQVYVELSNYELRNASLIAAKWLDQDLSEHYFDLIVPAAQYILSQRRNDGNYGYFADEKTVLSLSLPVHEVERLLAKNKIETKSACDIFLKEIGVDAPCGDDLSN